MLLGPRRVGKSVEIKRKIDRLVSSGIDPRRVFHAACDGWKAADLGLLESIAQEIAPADEGPRYFFVDEVTAIQDDWVSRLKWLRDNTALDGDCIVLSGSSSRELQRATKQLAGRRATGASHRTLLPMGFGGFCRAVGLTLPEVPALRAADLLMPEADDAIRELRPFVAEIVAAWERYLQVGGMPRAVADWVSDRAVSAEFTTALWDVVHGDALASDEWTEAQSEQLLSAIAASLTSFTNVERMGRDVGAHRETVARRLTRLQQSYLVWPCFRRGDGGPELRAQAKRYFIDPLHAQLAHQRTPERHRPDFTQLTEQQLGVALLADLERERPGELSAFNGLMHERSATGAEIDFVGPHLRGLPWEGKYTEGAWKRASQTAVAAYGRCVLATRDVIERDGDRRAVAAGTLALLIDHRAAAMQR
jgi:predicted AAA+ superfamily ATPase